MTYRPTRSLAVPAGTDVCDSGAPGIICEIDIALVVLSNIETPASLAGQRPGNVGGYFNYKSDAYGYVALNGNSAEPAAQISLVGYSGNLESGNRMFITNSVGLKRTPNNVIIGSGSSGGSSGGAWLVNFGVEPEDSSASASDAQPNTVIATTSWGYVSTSPYVVVVSLLSRCCLVVVSSLSLVLVAAATADVDMNRRRVDW